jgi:hypothetical protein
MKSMNIISLQLFALGISLCIATDIFAAERKAGYYLTKQQQVQADKIAATNRAKDAAAKKSAGNKNIANPAVSNNSRKASQSSAAAAQGSDSDSEVGGGGFDMFGDDEQILFTNNN